MATSLKVLRFLLCGTLLIALVIGCQDNKAILKESEKHLEAGTPQVAVDGLEAFIETAPEEPKARLLLGKAYNALGRHNDAVEQLRKASQLYAAQPEERIAARLELARTYLKFGDRTSAFRVLKLVQRSTSDPETLRKIIGLVGDSYQTQQLTTGDSDNYSPTFSPDGTQIAFASFRTDNGEIYLMDLNGRIRRRVTFTTDFNDSSPTFLTTPNYLFYSSEPKSSREVKVVIQSSGSTPIYAGFNLTHIHSKITRAVLPVSFGARVPRTSPASDQVIYESNADGNLELYLLDLEEVDLAQLTPESIKHKRITFNETDDGSPTFFPDGKRILFVSSRNEVNQLYTIDIDGQNETHFNPSRYDCYNPTVSPDGKTIAYVSARDGDWEIYLIDTDGRNERRITNDIGRSIQPAFSPDGRHLVFVSDRSDTFHIYLMAFDEPVTREDLVQRLQ
ncbi:MAG: DPP IV N-terminal domain-containing protein [Candidatus Poribacteria bacterium]|nr:DPP IV N-terminal domain-containing protein [Candidatus Poribacteria bacterium]